MANQLVRGFFVIGIFKCIFKVFCISIDSSINLVFVYFSAEILQKVVLLANLRIAALQLDKAGFFRHFCSALFKNCFQRYLYG
jgi:hypothetical protein